MNNQLIELMKESILNCFYCLGAKPGSLLPRMQYDSTFLDRFQVQCGSRYYEHWIEALIQLHDNDIIVLASPDDFMCHRHYNVKLTVKG